AALESAPVSLPDARPISRMHVRVCRAYGGGPDGGGRWGQGRAAEFSPVWEGNERTGWEESLEGVFEWVGGGEGDSEGKSLGGTGLDRGERVWPGGARGLDRGRRRRGTGGASGRARPPGRGATPPPHPAPVPRAAGARAAPPTNLLTGYRPRRRMALPESPPRASGRRAFAERQGRDKGFRAVRDN